MTVRVLHRALRALLVAALVLAGVLLPAGAASAHTSLVSSVPADGDALEVPPSQLVLTFSDELTALGAELVVTDGAGAPVAVTGTTVDGATATWALSADGPPGAYTATWRVVAGDGHPVEGTLAYTAASPVLPAEQPPTTSERPATSEPPATSSAPAATTGPSAAAPDPVDPLAPPTGGAGLAWVVASVGAVAAAAVVLARRRR